MFFSLQLDDVGSAEGSATGGSDHWPSWVSKVLTFYKM